MQSLRTRFPEDEEIGQAFYYRYNRAADGPLQAGEPLPDVLLRSLTGQLVNLSLYACATQLPVVVAAGSIS